MTFTNDVIPGAIFVQIKDLDKNQRPGIQELQHPWLLLDSGSLIFPIQLYELGKKGGRDDTVWGKVLLKFEPFLKTQSMPVPSISLKF